MKTEFQQLFKRKIYLVLFGFFGGIILLSLFFTHSNNLQFSIFIFFIVFFVLIIKNNYWGRIENKSDELIIKKKGWAKIEDKSDGPLSWTEYTDFDGFVYTIYNMMIAPATPNAYMVSDADADDCEHELVSTEYLSQTYGHCEGCGNTVVKDEDDNWRLL